MDTINYAERNREAWNQVTPIHQQHTKINLQTGTILTSGHNFLRLLRDPCQKMPKIALPQGRVASPIAAVLPE